MKQNEMEKLEHLVRMLRMGATVAAQESESVPDSDEAAICLGRAKGLSAAAGHLEELIQGLVLAEGSDD